MVASQIDAGHGPVTGSDSLPSVSIIVPVLNEAHAADALLQRLSELAAHDLVIVDGGSRDGTAQKLGDTSKHPALIESARSGRYRVLHAPKGRAAQMNFGARHANSDVLLFLHADSSFSSQHVGAAQHAIKRGADFGCYTLSIDSRDPLLVLAGRIISWRSRLLPSATGDQSIFMRRRLFEDLHGYREISLCEDLDLIRRARQRGRFTCVERDVTTSARRWEQRGVFRTILLMWTLRLGCHAGLDPVMLRRFYEDVR